MRLKEQRLWDTFRRRGKGLWLQRIENPMVPGMPDVFCGAGNCWVELKAPDAPKRHTTALLSKYGLNQDQVNWHIKAAHVGVRSFVLIRDSEKRLFLIPGSWGDYINEMTARMFQENALATDWDKILEVIG